jgi:hypothetical protein
MVPWLSVVGAFIVVAIDPAVSLVNQPQFNAYVALLTGLGMALGGFVICLLGFISGDRY